MVRLRIGTRGTLLACLLLTSAAATIRAGETTSAVRNAWEQFNERQFTVSNYGERAQVAMIMLEKRQARAELTLSIRSARNVVDSWRYPRNRWNSDQEQYFQGLKQVEQQAVALDAELEALNLRLTELNHEAVRQGEAASKRVKPMDLPGLLAELQRVDRETLSAFQSARQEINATAAEQKSTFNQVLQQSVAEIAHSEAAGALAPSRGAFVAEFRQWANKSSGGRGVKLRPGGGRRVGRGR